MAASNEWYENFSL